MRYISLQQLIEVEVALISLKHWEHLGMWGRLGTNEMSILPFVGKCISVGYPQCCHRRRSFPSLVFSVRRHSFPFLSSKLIQISDTSTMSIENEETIANSVPPLPNLKIPVSFIVHLLSGSMCFRSSSEMVTMSSLGLRFLGHLILSLSKKGLYRPRVVADDQPSRWRDDEPVGGPHLASPLSCIIQASGRRSKWCSST